MCLFIDDQYAEKFGDHIFCVIRLFRWELAASNCPRLDSELCIAVSMSLMASCTLARTLALTSFPER